MLQGLPARAWNRITQAWVRIALDGATAIAAFVLAQVILRQPAPIFAPIAAVVCLTDAPAARGPRALRLLLGVVAGVCVGEIAKILIGSGWLQVGAAVIVGMLVVSLGSINPLTLLQSGIAALLVVGIGSTQAGWTRLASALIGGALALLVSQVLISPSPTRELGDAAATALRRIAAGLEDVVTALRPSPSPENARRAAERLRGGHDDVAAFLDARTTSDRLARTTLRGRRERSALARMQDRLSGIEYVHAGAVLLARTAAEVSGRDEPVPDDLVDGVADLAAAIRALADHPRSLDPVPDEGVRSAHEVAEHLAATDPDTRPAGAARLATQLHLLAEDVDALTDPRRAHVMG